MTFSPEEEGPGVGEKPVGRSGLPPWPGMALSASTVLLSRVRVLREGGKGFSFSNLGILVALVFGSGGRGLGSSLWRLLVGSRALLSVSISSLGMGMPAGLTRLTLVPRSVPPTRPEPARRRSKWAALR